MATILRTIVRWTTRSSNGNAGERRSLRTSSLFSRRHDRSMPSQPYVAGADSETSSLLAGTTKLFPKRRKTFRYYCLRVLILFVALAAGVSVIIVRSETALSEPWVPDVDSRLFAQRPLPLASKDALISNYELPLRTRGRHIVDANGRRFKLSSVNWYGASDILFVPGGLEVQHRSKIAETIKKLGFNSVRLPYADELVMKNPVVDEKALTANPDLMGLHAMDVFEAVVAALTDAGLAVIINNHITAATWCCGANPCDAAWFNSYLGPVCSVKQSEEDWIEHWEEIMSRFVGNPFVIGADLRNEVRGLWGTMPWHKWAVAAEKCGDRLLKMKRDWLIVVEGTESANDVSGAATRPVKLAVSDRLVYSAHVYAWSGWGSWDGRFAKRSYASFVKTMRHNWAYLLEQDIAPVWVGEFGSSRTPSNGGARYWQHLTKFLRTVDADFGYWAIDPRKAKDNTKETYALVGDDWVTPLLDYRMKDMIEMMKV